MISNHILLSSCFTFGFVAVMFLDCKYKHSLLLERFENSTITVVNKIQKPRIERKAESDEYDYLLQSRYRTRKWSNKDTARAAGATQSSDKNWRQGYDRVVNNSYGSTWNFYGWWRIQSWNGGSRSPVATYRAQMNPYPGGVVVSNGSTKQSYINITMFDNGDLQFALRVSGAGKDCTAQQDTTSNACIVTINEGDSCQTETQIGSRFYNSSNIPWTTGDPFVTAKYLSDSLGFSNSIVEMYNGGNGYDKFKNEQRAIVLYDSLGGGILCGIMEPLNPLSTESPARPTPMTSPPMQIPTPSGIKTPSPLATTSAPQSSPPIVTLQPILVTPQPQSSTAPPFPIVTPVPIVLTLAPVLVTPAPTNVAYYPTQSPVTPTSNPIVSSPPITSPPIIVNTASPNPPITVNTLAPTTRSPILVPTGGPIPMIVPTFVPIFVPTIGPRPIIVPTIGPRPIIVPTIGPITPTTPTSPVVVPTAPTLPSSPIVSPTQPRPVSPNRTTPSTKPSKKPSVKPKPSNPTIVKPVNTPNNNNPVKPVNTPKNPVKPVNTPKKPVTLFMPSSKPSKKPTKSFQPTTTYSPTYQPTPSPN